jgi:hypothetical protein
MQEIIRNLKRMKKPGTDNINAEILQAAGPQTTQRTQEITLKKLNLRGDISLKLKQIFAYADDFALLARSSKALKEISHKLQNEAILEGLSINEHKTKYMQIKRIGIKDITHLKIDNFAFENVENFNYVGSILSADNKMNIEIDERIAKGNKA